MSKGRVWAGGLKPGHAQTVGGAIDQTLVKSQKRMKDLANKFAKAIIVELK